MERYRLKKQKQPIKAIREMRVEFIGGRENEGYEKVIRECGSLNCAVF